MRQIEFDASSKLGIGEGQEGEETLLAHLDAVAQRLGELFDVCVEACRVREEVMVVSPDVEAFRVREEVLVAYLDVEASQVREEVQVAYLDVEASRVREEVLILVDDDDHRWCDSVAAAAQNLKDALTCSAKLVEVRNTYRRTYRRTYKRTYRRTYRRRYRRTYRRTYKRILETE